MLASYGIESAADVDRASIRAIPGFGETLAENLVSWRRGHEQEFRFNPNEPVDPHDVATLTREIDAQQSRLVTALRQGVLQLKHLEREINAARARLMPMLERAWSGLKLAEAACEEASVPLVMSGRVRLFPTLVGVALLSMLLAVTSIGRLLIDRDEAKHDATAAGEGTTPPDALGSLKRTSPPRITPIERP